MGRKVTATDARGGNVGSRLSGPFGQKTTRTGTSDPPHDEGNMDAKDAEGQSGIDGRLSGAMGAGVSRAGTRSVPVTDAGGMMNAKRTGEADCGGPQAKVKRMTGDGKTDL